MRIHILLLLVLITIGCTSTAQTIQDNQSSASSESSPSSITSEEMHYEQIVSHMSLQEKKGLLSMVSIPDAVLSETTISFLKENEIAAVVLFNHNVISERQLKQLTLDLRTKVNPEMLIAIDQEGGDVARIPWDKNITITASMIGARNDRQYAYTIAYQRAKLLLDLGINVILGPVCDVASSNKSYLYRRAFGTNPDSVADMVEATVKAQRDAGIITVLKHFPGHGKTEIDSHSAFPVINLPEDYLWLNDFKPFIRGIEAGAEMVMLGHIINVNIDKIKPASISENYLELLKEVHFDGIVITDDLHMTGKIKSTIGWGINLVSGSFPEIEDKLSTIRPLDNYCVKLLELKDKEYHTAPPL